jgi:hypothetical protein
LKNIYIKYLYAFECYDLRNQIVSDADIREMPFSSRTLPSTGNEIESLHSTKEQQEANDTEKQREKTSSTQSEKEWRSKTFTSISRETFDASMLDRSEMAGLIAGE